MRYFRFVILVLLWGLAACTQKDDPAPTQLRIVTPIPTDAQVVALESTITALQATNQALIVDIGTLRAIEASRNADESKTPEPTISPTATLTLLPSPTILPSNFPTPRIELVTTVEQLFEGGRMIWFRETRTIWVLVGDKVDPEMGDWLCFEDTFVEGDTESLPTYEPPPNTTTQSTRLDVRVQQPIRGFGRIWRENPEVQTQLGWALTPEIEHSARREYLAGGRLVNDEYESGPGEWRIGSFYHETLLLFEDEVGSACPSGTWRLRR